MSLCLWGDCTKQATEFLDRIGRGVCKTHADYLQDHLANVQPCLGCRTRIIIKDSKTGQSAAIHCLRCGDTGIEPACVVKDIYGQLRDLGFVI